MNNFLIDTLKFYKKIKGTEANLKPCQIFTMERFVKMADGFKPFATFIKHSLLDI